MKKVYKFSLLAGLLGLVGAGLAGVHVSRGAAKETKATMTTEIPMEKESFKYGEGYEEYSNPEDAGTFADANATFWGDDGYSFNALGRFFRGETNEGWKGKLRTIPWTQFTQYVYFQWGGAKDYDVTGNVTLKFHYSHGEYDYSTELWNNTFCENPMLLKYFKIPDNQFANLTNGNPNGFEMYLELIDERSSTEGAYSLHNFGYLHVNQTVQQVGEAMRYYINHMDYSDGREWKVNNNKAIYNHYQGGNADLYSIYKDYVLGETSINNISEDFDDQDSFLDNWLFDPSYFGVTGHITQVHMDKFLSSGTVRPGDSQMPFNKTGNTSSDKFFRGWYENESEGGFVADDAQVYRFLSKPFKFTGSGIVSIKMAGTAALFLLDVTDPANPVVKEEIKNQAYRYNGEGVLDQRIDTGFNTCTMIRHVINFSAYTAEGFADHKFQLAIADYAPANWAAAYFDDLVVNYDISQGFRIDLINQIWNNGPTYYTAWLDKYVSCAVSNHISEAYGFIESYLSLARNGTTYGDMCDVITTNAMKTLIETTYGGLSNQAKAIVFASDDYDRGRNATGETWNVTPTVLGNLGQSITYIANYNNIPITNPALSTNGVKKGNNSAVIIVVAASLAMVALLGVGLLLIAKKKKEQE